MSKKTSSSNKIFIAFILNLCFAIFEFIGGVLSGSVSILSDSIHDLGDSVAIGLSYVFEKKSQNRADGRFTYGYGKYSEIGSLITSIILIAGSFFMIIESIERIIAPIGIRPITMLIISAIGMIINGLAAFVTIKGKSLNQESVSLHMIEDCLGWVAVFISSIIIMFTKWYVVDPIISICISVFLLIKAIKHCAKTISYLTNESPINTNEIKELIKTIDGVIDVHHIHIWKIDRNNICSTMHIVTSANYIKIKKRIRNVLSNNKINHSTIEIEGKWEKCENRDCGLQINQSIECSCCKNH